MTADQPLTPEQQQDDPYVRLIQLVEDFERLASLLPDAVDEATRPEMSWIIGSTRQVLGKAMTVIERDF